MKVSLKIRHNLINLTFLSIVILSHLQLTVSQVYDIVPNGENSVMYDVPINYVSTDSTIF